MEERTSRFALVILSQDTEKGIDFKVVTKNQGVPNEHIITLVRNWLKLTEKIYYDSFKEKHGM